MKAPGAAMQGGLAALGLIAAYTTWQRAPEKKAGEVVLVDATQSDVQKVRYASGTGAETSWVTLERRNEEDGPRVWLHVSAHAEQKIPERELRGNEAAGKLYEKLAPLKATRALGTMPAEKLKEVGLDAAKKHLELTVRGSTRSFSIGTSPFGVSDPYVKDDGDGKVYVLGGGVVSDLDGAATRLIDRALHDWKTTDYDTLVITVGDKKRTLVQTTPEVPAQAKLASKAGKTDELAKNWHDKIWRLLVSEVLGKGEVPAHGQPQVVVRIDYTQRGHKRGFIEVARVQAPAPAATESVPTPPTPPTPPIEIYARSESTAGWVRIGGNSGDVLTEADKVVSGD